MAYEEDKQSDQEVTDTQKRLETMRVELLQVFFDLKNKSTTYYRFLEIL